MALSTNQMLGIGAVAGLIGFLLWKKSKTASATTVAIPGKATPGTSPASIPVPGVSPVPATPSIPGTLAPSNPYPSTTWKGAGYDLGYADAAKDRSLGLYQNLSPEPPDVAYKQATDPFELEAGYVEGYNYYWKAVTV